MSDFSTQDAMDSESSNDLVYSLFGDLQKGYKRLVYDHMLPANENKDSCCFDLDGKDLQSLYDQAEVIRKLLEETFIGSLSGNHRLWPVDRYLFLASAHAIVYGERCVQEFLSQHGRPDRFIATKQSSNRQFQNHSPAQFMRWTGLELVEHSMCTFFLENGVDVQYEDHDYPSVNLQGIYYSLLRQFGKNVLAWGEFLSNIFPFVNSKKPLLLISNFFLSTALFKENSANVDVASLARFGSVLETNVLAPRRIRKLLTKEVMVRKGWKGRVLKRIRDTKYVRFESLIVGVIENYPLSLVEGREFLVQKASSKISLIRRLTGCRKIVLSVDHRVWKTEWPGAFGQVLVDQGDCMVGSQHGAYGLWALPFNELAEQVLLTHFLAFSKTPFSLKDKGGPEVRHVKIPGKFVPDSSPYSWGKGPFSVWYFPHHIDWAYDKVAGQYQITNNPRAEKTYERQKAIINELMRISVDRRVKEIVIKTKSIADPDERALYESMILSFMKRNGHHKIKISSNGDIASNLHQVDLAIHDMFSTGALQTLYKNIPTVSVLSDQEVISRNFKAPDNFLKHNMLIRDVSRLSELVLDILSSKRSFVGQDVEYVRDVWCGSSRGDIKDELVGICLE